MKYFAIARCLNPCVAAVISVVCVGASCLSTARAGELPKPVFYLPLDGSTTAAVAGGAPRPQLTGQGDLILAVVAADHAPFRPGRVGRSYEVENAPLIFDAKGNFRPDEGTCSFWINPNFRGDDKGLYCTFFGAEKWGMLYKYSKHSSITFGTAKPGGNIYYDCGTSISSWEPGKWHHVVVSWSRAANQRRIYVDGGLQARAPFPFHRAFENGPLFIGAGCLLYPEYIAHGRLDEVAIWDKALDEQAVRRLYELGQQGRPIQPAAAPDKQRARSDRINVVNPLVTGKEQPQPPRIERSATRAELILDGWWHFLPAAYALDELPADGWGLARVPGHFSDRDGVVGPHGKPARGKWRGRALSEYQVAYYQRAFEVPANWRGKQVFLHLGGVDGLAHIFLNGRRVGRLLCWEDEAYRVNDLVHYGRENTLTIALHSVGKATGIYGRVSVRALPEVFVRDVAIRPRVEQGRIEFSCDVCQGGRSGRYRLDFEIAPASEPGQTAKRFSESARLRGGKGEERELSGRVQRVECSFPWRGAHLWSYDDPYLYVLRVKLYERNKLKDEAPPARFGFREFTMRGSDFYLNGVRTYLRGHQVDLGWGSQMKAVKNIRAAGMNCMELSGPIAHRWSADKPYRVELFEEVLDYADEHGMITMPILPSARILQDRIFDADVAKLYQRRVEKHIRRYGNHPSICMWYMNFNLAGYRWYHAPTKIDGSHKPSDVGFLKKEKYSLETQRIVQTIDARPVYHHACGNFGDIFTLNCYIGPTSPIQEREEWPSRWAEKRPFPLIACEHGLLLIPYWFRLRRFPLSDVYSTEPIFDELTAMYLGPRAYRTITPELFDLYKLDGKHFSARFRQLIPKHPGYQEVKSLFARHSLRSWRTYGVSGIIWNAIVWDFRDSAGEPLPVMRALQQWFGDTDFYIAGPKGDFPSKDHSFYAGETVRKQVVLLNDLTHDIEDTLAWELADEAGRVREKGELRTRSRAGEPTFVPFAFTAPDVTERTAFRLTVRSALWPEREDAVGIEVFPAARPAEVPRKVLVYDPAGETARMLDRAGVKWEALTRQSRLEGAKLVVVGKKCCDEEFVSLAKRTRLEAAVAGGVNLLVFEQAADDVFGVKLTERSVRRVFVAWPGHPFLEGLGAEDFVNLRGKSDLIEPYPEAPPESERNWPERYFKWGNRGVVATFVCTKPHYAPYVPVLQCGFDLVESPLMEANIGGGRVVLCQLDVTSRYGTDPVSTRLVTNLLTELTRSEHPGRQACVCVGDSAEDFLRQFGITPKKSRPGDVKLVVVGGGELRRKQVDELESAARNGSTVLFLPNAASMAAFGLQLRKERFFIGKVSSHALLKGLGDADLYLKSWTEMPVAGEGDGWEIIAQPGIVAQKRIGRGRLVACLLDIEKLGRTRGRIKALRFWNILLADLAVHRSQFDSFLRPGTKLYEPNKWEQLPKFINW